MMPDLDRMIAGLRCRDLLTLLADYVDGELSPQEVERVDAHLQGCAYCTKFGGEYGMMVEDLKRRFGEPTVHSDVRARLVNRMEAMWASEKK